MKSLNRFLSGYPDWLEAFQDSAHGAETLRRLEKDFSDQAHKKRPTLFGASLRDSMLRACYCASQFDPDEDTERLMREAVSKARRGLSVARAGIRKARDFLRDHSLASIYITPREVAPEI